MLVRLYAVRAPDGSVVSAEEPWAEWQATGVPVRGECLTVENKVGPGHVCFRVLERDWRTDLYGRRDGYVTVDLYCEMLEDREAKQVCDTPSDGAY